MNTYPLRTHPRKRASFAGVVTALAVCASSIACSGDQPSLPGIDGAGDRPGTSELGTCESGAEMPCAITLSQQGGVLSCWEGVRHCVEGKWGECVDGEVVARPDPNHLAYRDGYLRTDPKTLALSSPTACLDNLCDPGCQVFVEDPPDLTASGGGGGIGAVPNWTGAPGPREPCYTGQQCQVNARCTEALTDSSCAHGKCAPGEALDPGCDDCVARVCAVDPSCCTDTGTVDWDANCIDLVPIECDAECGTITSVGCGHDACITGSSLEASCHSAVAAVCAQPGMAYCCDTATPDAWDEACIEELYIQETGSTSVSAPPGETICDYAVMGHGSAALYTTTVEGSVGWFNGSLQMAPASGTSPRPQVSGDVYSWGSAYLVYTDVGGDVITVGTSAAPFSSYASFQSPGTLPTPPPKPSHALTCPMSSITPTPPDNYAASDAGGGLAPGAYNVVQLSGDLTLQPGDYYVQSFNNYGGHELLLPTDPDDQVNIYACKDFQMNAGAAVTSPGDNPLQLVVYSDSGVINLHGGTYYGVYQAGNGTITLDSSTSPVTLYGMAHSYWGIVQTSAGTVVDASGWGRTDCFTRGVDTNVTPNPCPITTPRNGTAEESGTCVENGDSYRVSSSVCADVDLAVDLPCADTIPVCNHGNTDLPAGEAQLIFYPRADAQFATESPDPSLSVGTCAITTAIAAGSCIAQACDPGLLSEDLTVEVQLTSGASVAECSILDNWSYYVDGMSCTGGASVETHVFDYEAECPADSHPQWGFLTWETETPSNTSVTFHARTSDDGSFTGPSTLLGTAEGSPVNTSSCQALSGLAECPVRISDTLWPSDLVNQPTHLQLEITMNPWGSQSPTVENWEITYTCRFDQ